jgi:polysaccharide export outer membrane protein
MNMRRTLKASGRRALKLRYLSLPLQGQRLGDETSSQEREVVMRGILSSIFLTCVVILPAAAQSGPNGPQPQRTPGVTVRSTPGQAATPVTAPDDFVIGPEDVLQITVWREADLGTKAVVRPDGKIGVTLLGDIQASGQTTTQLKDTIASKLARYIEQPEVSVVVVEIHSQMVHLIGAVGRPGAYTLGGPLTIVELLARAGGLAEYTKGENIAVVRMIGKDTQRLPFNYKAYIEGRDLQQNIQLKNGDVVVVR